MKIIYSCEQPKPDHDNLRERIIERFGSGGETYASPIRDNEEKKVATI